MPRLSTQGPDWVPRNISFPLGLLSKLLINAMGQSLPEDFPDYVRRIMAEHVGYQRDLDYKYIREAIAKGYLTPAQVKTAEDLKLTEPRPLDESYE